MLAGPLWAGELEPLVLEEPAARHCTAQHDSDPHSCAPHGAELHTTGATKHEVRVYLSTLVVAITEVVNTELDRRKQIVMTAQYDTGAKLKCTYSMIQNCDGIH